MAEIAHTVVNRDHSHGCNLVPRAEDRTQTYLQDGSQICMFHVDWEIGMPVRIGYIQAKFVSTSAT